MALSIKSHDADRLARELARVTGESLTQTIVVSLRERLDRERSESAVSMGARLRRLGDDVAQLPVLDRRSPEEILGYDDLGLPR
jgi:antitoxin VapB